MNKNTQTILGISLGTREIGFAVFRDGEFLNWGVKTYKGCWSENKMERILSNLHELVLKYHISHFALKTPLPHTSSNSLTLLSQKVEQFAKDGSVTLLKYSLKEIYNSFPGNILKNRNAMIEFIVQHHPIFTIEQERHLKSSIPYYIKIFEAALTTIISRRESISMQKFKPHSPKRDR